MLCAAGKVQPAHVRVRLARLDPARAALPHGPRVGLDRVHRARRGHVPPRPPGGGVAGAVPADPRRARLRPVPGQPRAAHGALAVPVAGRGGREELVAVPAIHLDAALVPPEPSATSGATPPSSAPTSTSTTSCSRRPSSRFVSVERIVPTEDLRRRGRRRDPAADQPAVRRRRGRGAQRRPPHVVRSRLRRGTRRSSGSTRSPPSDPEAWDAFRAEWLSLPDEETYRDKVTGRSDGGGR